MCIARLQTQPRYDGTYPIDSDSLPIVLDGGSPEGDSELVTGKDRHEDVNGMTHDNTAMMRRILDYLLTLLRDMFFRHDTTGCCSPLSLSLDVFSERSDRR